MNQCAEHGTTQMCIKVVKDDISEIKGDIKEIFNVQERRTIAMEQFVPKSWLFTLIPIGTVIFGIAVYIATVDGRFADIQTVANHEYRIKAIEELAKEHHSMMKTMIDNQRTIIGRLPK